MTAGRHKTHIVTGIHIVRKPLKHGDRFYIYAWRGGPCIETVDGKYPVITPALLSKQNQVKRKRFGESKNGFRRIIESYLASPEFKRLEESTKAEYRRWTTRIDERFGNIPIRAFEDRRMRRDIIDWRNLWQHQPRTADAAATMMSTLLGWAMDQGLLKVNAAARIRQLYHADRADLIWEDRHWKAIEAAQPPDHLMDVLKMASWTGLRLGDIIRLDWEHIYPRAVIITTSKRKGRAVIPILPEFRSWLDKTPEDKRTGPVLLTSRGTRWTKSGLGSVYQKNKPEGFDRRFHDLRGTFCTMLILKGLTDDEAAMVMGWTAKRVSAIRARYVNEERVIINLLDRITA